MEKKQQSLMLWVEPAMLKLISRQLVTQFNEPVPRSALIRALIKLWAQGDIPITAAEVKALDAEEVKHELI